MTMEQIDTAARAIRQIHSDRIWANASVCGPPTPWDNLKPFWQDAYRAEAKAALEAAGA